MSEDADPAAMLGHAERVQARMRSAWRWYPSMMSAYGLVTIGLVAWIPLLHCAGAGIAFGLVAVAWAVAIGWWKHRHDVRPTSRRDTQKWVIAWVVLYTAAVSWFGPTYLDRTVGAWALMGLVVASPAFLEAARAWLRVRR
jgi:peptidoglycan biosynthesis protein MviN/MurJ (putative lipid II flippase)